MAATAKEVQKGVPYAAIPFDPNNREEWLGLRNKGIGGSDASVASGLNPYKTPYELYMEKTGQLMPVDLSDNERVHFGNVLEDVVAQEYVRRRSEREGREIKVRRVNRILQSKKHPFMLANLDRDVVGEPRLLECKTADVFAATPEKWGEEFTDQVPEHYLIQTQHYMGVTGYEVADLAVLIGGNTYRQYTIERNDNLINNLIMIEADFWERIEKGVPPEIDYLAPSTYDMLKRLYPGTNGKTIELTDDFAYWVKTMNQAGDMVKQYEAVKAGAKNHILAAMGENAIAKIAGVEGGFTRKTVQRKGFTVEPTSYVDFRFSAKA